MKIKLEALDDKSFSISEFPVLLGGESHIKWKLLEANQDGRPVEGYGILSDIEESMLSTLSEES